MALYQAKEEFSQSIARICVCVGALLFHAALYLFADRLLVFNISAILFYLLVSVGWTLWLKRTPGRYPFRISLITVPDMAINCLMMGTLEDYAAYFYPLFLWMIVGYGMRFGHRHLYRAWIVAMFFFGLTLVFSPYWSVNVHLGAGLFFGLIILPFFYVNLITKLHKLNLRLEDELQGKKQSLHEADRELDFLRAVNAGLSLEEVAAAVIERAEVMFPQIGKSRMLIRDVMGGGLHFAEAGGYDPYQLESPEMDIGKLATALAAKGEEIQDHIYLLKVNDRQTNLFPLAQVTQPKVMLALAVFQEKVLNGVLIFDSYASTDAFDALDKQKLESFKYHAVSAVNKTWLLKALRARNHELSVRQEQLVMQEKMASLGKITAGLAHEFQNPLNFINNFAQLSREQFEELHHCLKGPEQRNEEDAMDLMNDLVTNLKVITTHGERLSSLVRSMQSLALSEDGLTLLPVNDLLEECLALVFDSRRSIHVTVLLEPATDHLKYPGQSLFRAILNILKNAAEAIEARMKKEPGFQGAVSVRTHLADGQLEISIRDNGGGLAIDNTASVFDPFFTTKPPGSGHIGLGLTISYEAVVNKLGGTITHESNLGEGAVFTISLPNKSYSPLTGLPNEEGCHA
ncbi:MAG: ATP-binding protein [Acidobacteriota bacterium]|nr:ATP-binding protein [Acidobacteriota bacterium]